MSEKGQVSRPDQRIKKLLAEVLQMSEEKITDDLAMEDVDVWDSLKHMELIVSLEQTFEIELSFDEIVVMKTVAEIKRVLGQKSAVN